MLPLAPWLSNLSGQSCNFVAFVHHTSLPNMMHAPFFSTNFYLTLALAACAVSPVAAQNIRLQGRVLDAATEEPVPYAGIGVPGTTYGTVSTPEGHYELLLPETGADSVRIYGLGYGVRVMSVDSMHQHPILYLQSTPQRLPEVTVRPKKTNRIEMGSDRENTNLKVNFVVHKQPNQNLGSEVGRQFKLKNPALLEKCSFLLKYNNFDTVRFRVNVYTIQHGKPAQNITPENIIIELTGKKMGWIDVDLLPYDIECEDKIAISIEWVYSSGKGTYLALPIAMPMIGSTHFYKYGSQNSWKAFDSMSASLRLTVLE
jgi:hypothetical protein